MTAPNFWIKRRSKNWTGGRTDLHFSDVWEGVENHILSFNDAELAELKKVLAVGEIPCGECPAAKVYMEQPKYVAEISSDVALTMRRVQALENEVTHIKEDLSGHAGKHMSDNLVDKVGSLTINERQLRDRVTSMETEINKLKNFHYHTDHVYKDNIQKRLEGLEELARRLFHYEG